ncbi:MAG: hypothetical protein HWE07_04985 [Cytophagia bacterium]|nr:hypothetical protein [Cytophagia bacterium]
MIDDLVMVMEIDPPESILLDPEIPFDWNGILFSPFYRKGELIKYVGEFRNLRLVINSSKLTVSGSLHKFYHGNNSGDFTWREIQATLELLANVIGEDLDKAHLKKLTFACNLPIEAKPFLDRLISIKGRKPVNMVGGINHIPYGKYIKLTHYRIKIYDKKMEVNWHDRKRIKPTLRMEIEMNLKAFKSRKSNPIDINFLSDLFDTKFVFFCRQELLSVADQLEFTQDILPCNCTSSFDLECLALMKDMEIRLNYKRLSNPKTYRKKLKRYQELCRQFESNNLKQTLLTMVGNKLEELTNSDLTLQKVG